MIQEPAYSWILAFDTETDLIGRGNMPPSLMCASFAWMRGDRVEQSLFGNHPDDLQNLYTFFKAALEDKGCLIAGFHVSFDMMVMWRRFPDLLPLIWAKYRAQGVYCVRVGEALRAVSSHGNPEFIMRPDGSKAPFKIHLDSLAQKYLGKSRTAEKMDPAGWRTNYYRLDSKRADEYPEQARRYALEDAYDTLLIARMQFEQSHGNRDYDTNYTARYRSIFPFAYACVGARGICLDQKMVKDMEEQCAAAADPSNLPNLVSAGYLVPAQGPRLAKRTKTGKMTKGQDEKFKDLYWRIYVLGLICGTPQGTELEVELTDKGQERLETKALYREQILEIVAANGASGHFHWAGSKATEEFLKSPRKAAGIDQDEALHLGKAGLPICNSTINLASVIKVSDYLLDCLIALYPQDPYLEEYQRREEVDKIRTTLLPNIKDSAVAWTNYEYPKMTMRGSSRIDRNYPTLPIQQMPKGIAGMDPRQIIQARPGHIFIDADFQALELCTTAQTTYSIFGRSGIPCRLRELINEGVDMHTYLGAQLAVEDPQVVEWYRRNNASSEVDRYKAFLQLKKIPETAALFKHWRTFAKPVNLGYPGMLGPAGMVLYAKAIYGLDLTQDRCARYKEMWMRTLPEMAHYFEYVKRQIDTKAPNVKDDEGKQVRFYAYRSPLGNMRRGCFITDASNGMCMQTPAAEGFHIALAALTQECSDPSTGSVLYGSGVIIPFHDQFVVEVPYDDWALVRARAKRVQEVMEQSMSIICPDVKIKAAPCLSFVWSKDAEPVFDANGELIPWMPKAA